MTNNLLVWKVTPMEPEYDPTIVMILESDDLEDYESVSPLLLILFNQIWASSGMHIVKQETSPSFEIYFRDLDAFTGFYSRINRSIPSSEKQTKSFKWSMRFTQIPPDLTEADLIAQIQKRYKKMKIHFEFNAATQKYEIIFPNSEAYAASFLELIQGHPNSEFMKMLD